MRITRFASFELDTVYPLVLEKILPSYFITLLLLDISYYDYQQLIVVHHPLFTKKR